MLEKGEKKLAKMFPMKICQWYQFPAFLEIKNFHLWEECWVGGMYPTLPFSLTCEVLRNMANFLATTERLTHTVQHQVLNWKKLLGSSWLKWKKTS